MPRSRPAHGISVAQSVPATASRNSAIGRMHSGRLSESTKALVRSVGTRVTAQITTKIETSVVDHGNETAIRTATISAVFVHAVGSRQTGSAGATGELSAPALTRYPR